MNCELVTLETRCTYFRGIGWRLELQTGRPLDTLDTRERVSLLDQVGRYIDPYIIEAYVDIFIRLAEGEIDNWARREIGNMFNTIHFIIASKYACGGTWDLTGTLIHASAQRGAILAVVGNHYPQNRILSHAEYSRLISREMALYRELNSEYHRPMFIGNREANLRYWHAAWIDGAFFDEVPGRLSSRKVSISRAEIVEKYANPYSDVLWIGFEGLDGSGKDTQLSILEKYLGDTLGFSCRAQPVPTTGVIGRLARRIVQRREDMLPNEALQKLFIADRLAFLVPGNVEDTSVLVTNRYSASGIAYGSHSHEELVNAIVDNIEAGGSDITIYLDLPAEVCIQRIDRRGGRRELFEEPEQLRRIRSNYLRLSGILPNFRIIAGIAAMGRYKTVKEIFVEIINQIVEYIPDEKLSKGAKQKLIGNLKPWVDANQELFMI